MLDGLGSTHNVGEALDIIDDIGDNLCPNPSTGTSGQVCARNAAGDAYELVDAGTGSPSGSGSGGGGYSAWGDIGSVTGAISGPPVTDALDTGDTIDDFEELYIHIQANDANDASSTSHRIRVSDIPETTRDAAGGINIGFPGPATDEGALLASWYADGDTLVQDPA